MGDFCTEEFTSDSVPCLHYRQTTGTTIKQSTHYSIQGRISTGVWHLCKLLHCGRIIVQVLLKTWISVSTNSCFIQDNPKSPMQPLQCQSLGNKPQWIFVIAGINAHTMVQPPRSHIMTDWVSYKIHRYLSNFTTWMMWKPRWRTLPEQGRSSSDWRPWLKYYSHLLSKQNLSNNFLNFSSVVLSICCQR